MSRRLLSLVTAVSLVLCVAVVVLWIRSRSRFDRISYGTDAAVHEVGAYPGVLFFSVTWPPAEYEHRGRDFASAPAAGLFATADEYAPWSQLGIAVQTVSGYLAGQPYHVRGVHVRYLWPLAATALIPALRLMMWRGKRPGPHGLCPTCGYDLRATPERCPECGMHPTGADT